MRRLSKEVTIQLSENVGDGNSHRFLVQAARVDGEEQLSKDQWDELTKDKIQEEKQLRCVPSIPMARLQINCVMCSVITNP